MIIKPNYIDSPKYCHYFFDLIEENNLIGALQKSYEEALTLMTSIPKEKENYRYLEGKWTIKEVLRHVIDSERVYAYRALRFSRFDDIELPGFDENQYIVNSQSIQYTLQDLAEEYANVRKSTIDLFKPMTNDMLNFRGIANKLNFTARSLGYMIVGHNIHHCNFIKTRYL